MATDLMSQRLHLDALVVLPHIAAAEGMRESSNTAVISFPLHFTSVEATQLGHRNYDEVCFTCNDTGIWN